MFAAKRNLEKYPGTSKTKLAAAHLLGVSLVFLRDWSVSAKLTADGSTGGLANIDALRVGVGVDLQPMEVQ